MGYFQELFSQDLFFRSDKSEGSNAKLWGFLNKNGTFSIVMRMLSLAQQLPTTFSVLLRDFVYM